MAYLQIDHHFSQRPSQHYMDSRTDSMWESIQGGEK